MGQPTTSNPSTSGQAQMGMPNQAAQNYGGSQPPQLSVGQAGGPSGKGGAMGSPMGGKGMPQQGGMGGKGGSTSKGYDGGGIMAGIQKDSNGNMLPGFGPGIGQGATGSTDTSGAMGQNLGMNMQHQVGGAMPPSLPQPANFQEMLGGTGQQVQNSTSNFAANMASLARPNEQALNQLDGLKPKRPVPDMPPIPTSGKGGSPQTYQRN